MTYKTFPASPGPASVKERNTERNLLSRSHSGKRQVRSLEGQMFGWDYTFGALKLADARSFQGFVAGVRGQFEPFFLALPNVLASRSGGSGNGLVKTTTASGATVPGKGYAAGALVAKSGDFIQFAGHTKLYRLTADVTANGSGDVSFSIAPPLLASVAANEAVALDGVQPLVALASDQSEFDFTPGIFGAFSPSFVEVLP